MTRRIVRVGLASGSQIAARPARAGAAGLGVTILIHQYDLCAASASGCTLAQARHATDFVAWFTAADHPWFLTFGSMCQDDRATISQTTGIESLFLPTDNKFEAADCGGTDIAGTGFSPTASSRSTSWVRRPARTT